MASRGTHQLVIHQLMWDSLGNQSLGNQQPRLGQWGRSTEKGENPRFLLQHRKKTFLPLLFTTILVLALRFHQISDQMELNHVGSIN